MSTKPPVEKHPGGRPEMVIDLEKLETCLKLGAALQITADLLGCSPDTVEARVKQHYDGMNYKTAREKKSAGVKLKLIQTAVQKAFDGDNTMLIFCLKNLAGWADRVDNVSSDGSTRPQVQVVVSLPSNGREVQVSPYAPEQSKIVDVNE